MLTITPADELAKLIVSPATRPTETCAPPSKVSEPGPLMNVSLNAEPMIRSTP